MLPNYPNPFNARTALRFHLPLQGKIHISIYDLSGKYICTPVDKTLPKGEHTEIWDAGTVSSGMYIALMRVNGEIVDSRKLLLVR
ncbi:MAG: T9SS type A sorting domain-containing protein [Fidelibacterota bacterium]